MSLLHEAHPRRAPQPVALAVPRRLRDLARVEPVEQGLLADLQLVSDFERRQVLHLEPAIRDSPPRWDPSQSSVTRSAGQSTSSSRTRRRRAESAEHRMRNTEAPGGVPFSRGRLARVGDRDERFEAEALPHLRSLYGTAYRMTRNAHDAEDLVQETFLRAYRAFDRYEPGHEHPRLAVHDPPSRADRRLPQGRPLAATVELVDEGPAVPAAQDALACGQRGHRARAGRAARGLPQRGRPAGRRGLQLRRDRAGSSTCPSAP